METAFNKETASKKTTSKKMAVLEAEIKPLRDKEMGREVYEMLVITRTWRRKLIMHWVQDP